MPIESYCKTGAISRDEMDKSITSSDSNTGIFQVFLVNIVSTYSSEFME